MVIPAKVDKAANANVAPNVHCEGILEVEQKESKRGIALLLDWDSEVVNEERRQKYADTEEALVWVH